MIQCGLTSFGCGLMFTHSNVDRCPIKTKICSYLQSHKKHILQPPHCNPCASYMQLPTCTFILWTNASTYTIRKSYCYREDWPNWVIGNSTLLRHANNGAQTNTWFITLNWFMNYKGVSKIRLNTAYLFPLSYLIHKIGGSHCRTKPPEWPVWS